MAGVRVRHPEAKNARFNLSDPNTPYAQPYQCTPPEFGGCGQVHVFKTHHINLDETGTAIIESVLLERIKPYLLAYGFTIEEEVAKPPVLGIGLGVAVPGTGQWGNIPIIGEGNN